MELRIDNERYEVVEVQARPACDVTGVAIVQSSSRRGFLKRLVLPLLLVEQALCEQSEGLTEAPPKAKVLMR